MSTRPDTTSDDTTTSPRTDPTTALSTDTPPATADAPPATADAATSTADAPAADDGISWTDRCRRQFATDDASRMRNLTDDHNQAMPDGV